MVMLTEQIVKGKTRLERLDEVKNLNLWGQDIDDVSVLTRMPNVEVLSFSVNRINALRDFRNCKSLKELYLRKNCIVEISDLQYLSGMKDLKVLWLCDNPIADHPYYRPLVAAMLPSVDKLDNTDIMPYERDAACNNPDIIRFMSTFAVPTSTSSSTAVSPKIAAGVDYQDDGFQSNYSPNYPSSYPAPGSRSPSGHLTPPAPVTAGYAPGIPPPYQGNTPVSYNGYGGITPTVTRPGSRTPTASIPSSAARAAGVDAAGEGLDRRRKNILYAVMALVSELEEEDLAFVKKDIEQRLASLGR